jgi:Domain of unknown function (DUF4760)
MTPDQWIAFWTMLLFSATLLGAIFVLVELRNGHRENKAANSRAKKQATVDFYTQTLERRINWQMDLPLGRDRKAVELVLGQLKENPQSEEIKLLKNKIHAYLGFWELTAVAIRHDVFDEALFQDILKTHFLQVEEHYRPFMTDARNEIGENGTQLYVQFEQLAAEWRGEVLARRRGLLSFLLPNQANGVAAINQTAVAADEPGGGGSGNKS